MDTCISSWNWATTTFFGDSPIWPGGGADTSVNICNIISNDSDEYPIVGAAIPFPIQMKRYNTRINMLNSIIDNFDEKSNNSNEKHCYIIQPIRIGNTETNFSNIDVNNDKFAKDDNGNDYPTFFVVPFQYCGGDCKIPSDCFNGCEDYDNILLGNKPKNTDNCQVVNSYYNNDWTFDKNTYDSLIADGYACIPAIGDETRNVNYNTEKAINKNCTKVNWCSGSNMHFDIYANTDEPNSWLKFWNNNNKEFSDEFNVFNEYNRLVRFKQVPCHTYHKKNIQYRADKSVCENAYSTNYLDCSNLQDNEYCLYWNSSDDKCNTTKNVTYCQCQYGYKYNTMVNKCVNENDPCSYCQSNQYWNDSEKKCVSCPKTTDICYLTSEKQSKCIDKNLFKNDECKTLNCRYCYFNTKCQNIGTDRCKKELLQLDDTVNCYINTNENTI